MVPSSSASPIGLPVLHSYRLPRALGTAVAGDTRDPIIAFVTFPATLLSLLTLNALPAFWRPWKMRSTSVISWRSLPFQLLLPCDRSSLSSELSCLRYSLAWSFCGLTLSCHAYLLLPLT